MPKVTMNNKTDVISNNYRYKEKQMIPQKDCEDVPARADTHKVPVARKLFGLNLKDENR